eukprot:3671539-Karenia_brevis.AAC.1
MTSITIDIDCFRVLNISFHAKHEGHMSLQYSGSDHEVFLFVYEIQVLKGRYRAPLANSSALSFPVMSSAS